MCVPNSAAEYVCVSKIAVEHVCVSEGATEHFSVLLGFFVLNMSTYDAILLLSVANHGTQLLRNCG